jgi:hypothetical protein
LRLKSRYDFFLSRWASTYIQPLQEKQKILALGVKGQKLLRVGIFPPQCCKIFPWDFFGTFFERISGNVSQVGWAKIFSKSGRKLGGGGWPKFLTLEKKELLV